MPTGDSNRPGVEYKLSAQEIKFVAAYIETGKTAEAVKLAGYNTTSPACYGRKLLGKQKIKEEMRRQLDGLRDEFVASNSEIMEFFTKAMRGEVKDQFGLDPTLADRMKAAEALAKRRIDMENMLEKAKDNEVRVNVFFGDTPSTNEE
jgi:Phage terminase, small subunit